MQNYPKTIIAVDDDEDILILLDKILKRSGYFVITAKSPVEGRKHLTESAPHLILTDLHMAPEDGYDFIQSVRNQEHQKTLPILVLSALNDFSSVKKAIALGVDDYVIKPIDEKILLRKIQKALQYQEQSKWLVPDERTITIETRIEGEIISLGDKGYELKGPFKLGHARHLQLVDSEIPELLASEIKHKTGMSFKRYSQNGYFINDIKISGQEGNIKTLISILRSNTK